MKRALACCAGIAILACGPTSASHRAADASSPPARSPSLAPGAPVEVLSVVFLNGDITVDLVTVSDGSASGRRLLTKQPIGVLDANQRVALITTTNSTQLATLDLDTGAIRALGVKSAGNVGPGVLSPDGSEAAVEVRHADLSTYEIDIVNLVSGAARHLLDISASAYNRAGLSPLRWANAGILVSPGVWDGPHYKLLKLDPQTGALTTLTGAQVDILSPDAGMMAAAEHANLGDAQFEGQGTWPNRLVAGTVGPPPAVIAEHKNRALYALDIGNNGSLLYAVDDAPFATGKPAPDMGIYLEAGGQTVQQLGEAHIAQWTASTFVGSGQALASMIVTQGPVGSAEVALVDLCTRNGCIATTTTVLSVSGTYPAPRLLLLRPVPAT